MTARAETTAATAERILDAVTSLFWERPSDQVVLRDVAERAGVSVQTVLRRFGSREELIAAAADRATTRTMAQRDVPANDLARAVTALEEHYEEVGAGVLRLLAAAQSSEALAELTARGQDLHRAWCERTFPEALRGLTGEARRRRLAQVVAVCDVYTWKLLRLDSGLSRDQTRLALRELLVPLLDPDRSS